MKIIHSLRDTWRGLFECERGNALMIFGLIIMALVGATGSAVDMGRAQLVKAKLSYSLDAAGLAAGGAVNSEDIDATVDKYFYANFPNGFMDTSIHSVTAVLSEDKTKLNLQAVAEVGTTFMQVLGMTSIDVDASSEITRSLKGMELILVMDNTGSMASSSKISTMKDAASLLINILYGDNSEIDDLYVGLVPYVTNVNIGPDKTAWLSNYDESRYTSEYPAGATKWKGCTEARVSPYDVAVTPPDAGNPDTLWPVYFWEDSDIDNDWIESDGDVDLNEAEGYSNGGGRGPNIGCGPEVTPFTASKSTILDGIEEMEPWRRGGTMSNVGLVWAWRMMDPGWRGMWNHANGTLPLDYDAPLMEKVVVILTDGQNQFYDYTSSDAPYSDYTPYGRLDDLRADINTTNQGTARGIINQKFLTVCDGMKQQGITIYTITFRLGSGSANQEARDTFRQCASYDDFYFDSPDNATLDTIFSEIGDSLANLHISQ